MKTRKILRFVSLIMLIAAVIFIFCALSAPNLGRTVSIGDFTFGAKQWRICYAVYVGVMIALFVASFFVKKSDGGTDKSGIPEATVAKILNDATKSPETTAVAPIAAALGVSVGDEEDGECSGECPGIRPEDRDKRDIALLLQNYEKQTERLVINYEKQLRVKEIWIRALAAFLFVQIGVLLFLWRNL